MPAIVIPHVSEDDLPRQWAEQAKQVNPRGRRTFRVTIEPEDRTEDIENGKLSLALAMRGMEDEEGIPITEINAASPSFDFLNNEPDIYTDDDLKERYA